MGPPSRLCYCQKLGIEEIFSGCDHLGCSGSMVLGAQVTEVKIELLLVY